MAAVLTLPDPDIVMQDGPWDVGFFRVNVSGCGEADDPDQQGIVLTDDDLRGN